MFPWYTSPTNDIDLGRKAFNYFHNASLSYPGYKFTVDQALDLLTKNKADIFLESLGFSINQIDMSEGQIRDAMQSLAMQAKGKMPNQTAFFQALSNRVSNLTFTDWVRGAPEIATGIASDAVQGAKAVGDKVISAADFLSSPIGVVLVLVVVGGGAFVYLKSVRAI